VEEIIEEIVDTFYEKAVKDILIGYHFRKIQKGDNLVPSLSDFAHHLPRIKIFWKSQLIKDFKSSEKFNLKESHKPLKIRKGELDRFILLFNKTLDVFESKDINLIKDWRSKLQFFKSQFHKF
jgi:truncated hemoglobin YjbI